MKFLQLARAAVSRHDIHRYSTLAKEKVMVTFQEGASPIYILSWLIVQPLPKGEETFKSATADED